MPDGLANGYQRKPSGNSPLAAGWNQNAMSGVTTSGQAVGTWRTPGREYSLSTTLAKTVLSVLRPLVLFRRMATACTTWPATSGSGAVTGTGSMLTLRRRARTFVATPPDRRRVLIHQIPTPLSGWSKGAHSFATPRTVRVIAPARAEERRPIPVRPIRAFGALSLATTAKLPARLEDSLL